MELQLAVPVKRIPIPSATHPASATALLAAKERNAVLTGAVGFVGPVGPMKNAPPKGSASASLEAWHAHRSAVVQMMSASTANAVHRTAKVRHAGTMVVGGVAAVVMMAIHVQTIFAFKMLAAPTVIIARPVTMKTSVFLVCVRHSSKPADISDWGIRTHVR